MMTPECYYTRLKKYLEDSDVGHDMAAPLMQGSVVHTDIEGDPQKYELIKICDRCVLRPRKTKRADLYFGFTRGSLDYLLEPCPKNVHDLMNRFFDCLLENRADRKAELKVLVSQLEAAAKGYLKMLKLGGHRAVPTLAKIGVKLPPWIK